MSWSSAIGTLLLESLCKSFAGNARAVDQLSLTVGAGERVVLLGPSGCGKTTTLRLVAGLETPDAGRVRLDGVDATDWPPRRRDVALVFQDASLYPHLDVRGNLAFGPRLRKWKKKEIADGVEREALLGPGRRRGGEGGEEEGGDQRLAAHASLVKGTGNRDGNHIEGTEDAEAVPFILHPPSSIRTLSASPAPPPDSAAAGSTASPTAHSAT